MGERQVFDLDEISDPVPVIDVWQGAARAAGARIPEAATLATLAPDGAPRARVVLLRGRNGRVFHFFTNYQSDKGEELAWDPRAALVIHHVEIGVQARIEGRAERLSAAESDAYFRTRPRLSQLGAWASAQSRPLATRDELERALSEVSARFGSAEVPRPSHWGGYGLQADRIELWVDREGRLHDRVRFRYVSGEDAGVWSSERLWP